MNRSSSMCQNRKWRTSAWHYFQIVLPQKENKYMQIIWPGFVYVFEQRHNPNLRHSCIQPNELVLRKPVVFGNWQTRYTETKTKPDPNWTMRTWVPSSSPLSSPSPCGAGGVGMDMLQVFFRMCVSVGLRFQRRWLALATFPVPCGSANGSMFITAAAACLSRFGLAWPSLDYLGPNNARPVWRVEAQNRIIALSSSSSSSSPSLPLSVLC